MAKRKGKRVMERDKYGYFRDDGDDMPPVRSSSINARSTAINKRLNQEPYRSINQSEFEQVIFDQPTNRTNRRRDEVIEEYYRRDRRLPNTNSDHRIKTTEAYRLPRTPQPIESAPKKISKRKLFGLLGIGIGAVVIGTEVANQAHIEQRMKLGQYSFITETVQNIAISTWITPDYTIHFHQVNDAGKSPDDQHVSVGYDYRGPLDQVVLAFQFQQKLLIISMTAGSIVISTPFHLNQQFFVEGES
jgi:hypothetical protein